MKSYRNKPEIREMLINHYNSGKAVITKHAGCPVCSDSLRLNTKGMIYLHHMYHDTPGNRIRNKLLIHSPANLLPYHAACQGPENIYVIKEYHADLYEIILKTFKDNCTKDLMGYEKMLESLYFLPEFQELEKSSVFDYYTFYLTTGIIYQKVLQRSKY